MTKIGIVGTAKNTGKTTTLSAILTECLKRKITFSITSIGYDGEDLDNLTYLPKPKLNLMPGAIVATSELCLKSTKAKFEILSKSNVKTPLGMVYIIRITKEGEMVLAGPNNIAALKKILSKLEEFNTDLIFIDGALNRMAPMYLMEKIVFCTGASRNTNIELLSDELKYISNLFKFENTKIDVLHHNSIQVLNGGIHDTKIFSLLSEDDLNELAKISTDNYSRVFIPNIFSLSLFKKYISTMQSKNNLEIIFLEPFRILLAANDYSELDFLFNSRVKFKFLQKPELTASTINPFYPHLEDFHFRKKYIDKNLMYKTFSTKVSVPVYNIMEFGTEEIMNKLVN